MDYEYSITVTYDSAPTPTWVGRYDNALSAVTEINKIVDWGFADEYATVNLSTLLESKILPNVSDVDDPLIVNLETGVPVPIPTLPPLKNVTLGVPGQAALASVIFIDSLDD